VDYLTLAWNGTDRTPNDEDDVIAALEHPDRVRSIKLAVTSPQLGIVASVMQEPFLALKDLRLSSNDRNVPVLPDAFLGGSAPTVTWSLLRGDLLQATSIPSISFVSQ
jgi:hypothetical protein